MESLRILVVEDDELVGSLLAEMLSAMGHRVEAVVPTEQQAIEAARLYEPDLIILDETLKSGFGSSAISHIQEQRPVAHVLMSGAPLVIPLLGAIFLKKPFFESDLQSAMNRALAPPVEDF